LRIDIAFSFLFFIMLLFSRIFVFFIFYFFLSCQALQCTTNCSYTYNFTQPFNIPDRCNQIVSAGKCLAFLTFSYGTREYTIQFQGDSSTYISNIWTSYRVLRFIFRIELILHVKIKTIVLESWQKMRQLKYYNDNRKFQKL
jgi:hypothetical protein